MNDGKEARMLDFRAVCEALCGAVATRHALDLGAQRLELDVVPTTDDRAAPLALAFEGVTRFQWQSASAEPYERMELAVAGLERLAAGDVWRLYLSPGRAAALELSCRRITCDGAEVTGVGRHYREAPPRRAPLSSH